MTIEKASAADQAEILVLYRSLIGQPGCTWCEEYPDEEIVAEDLHSGSLYWEALSVRYPLSGGTRRWSASTAGQRKTNRQPIFPVWR